jgi:hypothetical protein
MFLNADPAGRMWSVRCYRGLQASCLPRADEQFCMELKKLNYLFHRLLIIPPVHSSVLFLAVVNLLTGCYSYRRVYHHHIHETFEFTVWSGYCDYDSPCYARELNPHIYSGSSSRCLMLLWRCFGLIAVERLQYWNYEFLVSMPPVRLLFEALSSLLSVGSKMKLREEIRECL